MERLFLKCKLAQDLLQRLVIIPRLHRQQLQLEQLPLQVGL